MKWWRALVKFIRDSAQALAFDEYDIRARKEADDKQKRWYTYLGSGGR